MCHTHTHTHMQHTLTYLNCSNGKFKFQIEILKSLSDEVVRRSFVWKLQIMSQATEKNLKSVAGDGRRPEICRMQRCIKNWQVNPLCNRFPVFCGGKKNRYLCTPSKAEWTSAMQLCLKTVSQRANNLYTRTSNNFISLLTTMPSWLQPLYSHSWHSVTIY